MNTIKLITDKGMKNGQDVTAYLLTGPTVKYLVDGTIQEKSTMWYGGGLSKTFGICDKEVKQEDMQLFFQGFDLSGNKMRQNAGNPPKVRTLKDIHGKPRLDDNGNVMTVEQGARGGYDITHSVPKSVSLLWSMSDDQTKRQIEQAIKECVEDSMKRYEQLVEVRTGQGGKDVKQDNKILYSAHMQFGNRNLEPHLHVHVLTYNFAQNADGKSRGMDGCELFRWRKTNGMLFDADLSCKLKELGFKIHQTEKMTVQGEKTGERSWEVAGLHDRKLIEAVSSRHLEIAKAKGYGMSDQDAWARTRKHKDEPDFLELVDYFQKLNDGLREEFNIPSLEELKEQKDVMHATPNRQQFLERLHTTNAVVSEPEILQQIMQECRGHISTKKVRDIFNTITTSSEIVAIDPLQLHEDDRGASLSRVHTETRFAAKFMLEMEMNIVHMVKKREQEERWKFDVSKSLDIIKDLEKEKGFKVSDEQRAALLNLTCETGGIGVLKGLAGTGKTTVSEFYKKIFEANGSKLYGCAVSNEAAAKLQKESDIESKSVAKLLSMLRDKKKPFKLTSTDVVVVDEAGMMDTAQFRALGHYCAAAGAKMVIQGDIQQIAPVGAGQGMSLIQDVMKTSQLTEIRRQKLSSDKDIAKAFYEFDEDGKVIDYGGPQSREDTLKKSAVVWAKLVKNNSVIATKDRDDTIKSIVKDYLTAPCEEAKKIILAHTNSDIIDINTQLRTHYKDAGRIKDVVQMRAVNNTDFFNLEVGVGERIRFTANDTDMKVNNGTKAVITAIKPGRKEGFDITCMVSQIDGTERELKFNTSQYCAINHNYASTIHMAQGQGASNVFHMANVGMADNSSMLVAFTRLTDGQYKMYGDYPTIDSVKERLKLDRQKSNVLASGIKGNSDINKKFQEAKQRDTTFKIKTRPSNLKELNIDEWAAKVSEPYIPDPNKQEKKQVKKQTLQR